MVWNFFKKKTRGKSLTVAEKHQINLMKEQELMVKSSLVLKEKQFIESLLNRYEIMGVELNKGGVKQYVCIQPTYNNVALYLVNEHEQRNLYSKCYANFTRYTPQSNKVVCSIQDLQVFNENQGEGSILLKYLIKYVKRIGVWEITGWLSSVDKDSFDKLEYFYKKNGFTVKFNDTRTEGYIHLKL